MLPFFFANFILFITIALINEVLRDTYTKAGLKDADLV
jgi:hypothetical protein